MGTFLLVPIHLDALWVESERDVVQGFADFTALPWSNGRRDVNPDTPWLAEAILTPPFQDRPLTLRPGLHLHWTLPAALSRRHDSRGGRHAGQWTPAPNRWLVSRHRDNSVEQQWLIESDYLHPPGLGDEAIAWPLPPRPGQMPWRRLGRVLSLNAWGGNQAVDADYLERLTAVGYGDLAFASWYPASHSVFGFHDAGVVPQQRDQLSYEVLGWYHDPADDPLQGLADAQTIAARLDWTVPDKTPSALPRRTVCFARSTLDAPVSKTPPHAELAVAPTGSEALSALLAHHLSNQQERAGLEDLLESVDLAAGLEHHQLDVGPKFREARHEKGFVAVPAGQRWNIRPERDSGGASPHDNEPLLPHAIAELLERVNRAQQAHDTGLHRLEALRDQLYADWCKYQHCCYPPEDGRESYPDPNQLRDFIERADLQPLREQEALTGNLQLALDPQGRFQDARGETDSSAGTLATALRTLQTRLQLFSRTGFSGELHGTPAIVADAERGHALRFDGRRDWLQPDHCIDGPAPAYLQPAAVPALTVAVWVRSRHPGTIAGWDAQVCWSLFIDAAGRVVFASTAPGDGPPGHTTRHRLHSRRTVNDGRWHHIAIGYRADDGRKSIWIDGELDNQEQAHDRFPLGSGKPCRGSIGAALVLDADGNAEPPQALFKGALTQFRLLPSALPDERMAELHQAKAVAGIALRRTPAPRYWQPREPVLLIRGALAARKSLRRPTGPLSCGVADDPALAAFDTADGAAFAPIAAALRRAVAALAPTDGTTRPGFDRLDGSAFEPLLLEWQAEVWPLRDGFHEHAADGRYSADHITASHRFSPDRVDLEPLPGSGRVDPGAAIVSGRCILSGHAHSGLRRQLTELLDDAATRKRFPQLTKVLQVLDADDGPVLSQALGGFNAALLQRHQVLQLPIADPLGFADQAPFTAAVAAAVGRAATHGALPSNAFMPVAAGAMRVLRLRLLDRFGRTRELDVSRIASPQRLQIPGSDHLLRLPPRLSQPARIELRWLAADDGIDEMNDHPRSSPICGWLLPNNLDDRVAVYDPTLTPLGRLGVDARGHWHPPVGAELAGDPHRVSNPGLRRLLHWLLAQPGTFLKSDRGNGFRERLEQALETIHPANADQHNGLALLLGSPIAVVRLRLALQMKGALPVNQDWNVLRRNLHSGRHDDSGFGALRIPVLLGAPEQVNDGLIGYWRESDDGALGPFEPAGEAAPIELTPNGPAVTVTALIDPRCALHAVSGVLPVKSIDLPPAHYAEALGKIGAGFLTAPLITDAGKVNLPLPSEPGYTWSWLARDGHAWERLPGSALGRPSRDARLDAPQEIREGWLQLRPTTEDDSP